MSPAPTRSSDMEATVLAHQPLARRLARRYARGDADLLEELEQVAALGLVKAARRFDSERGTEQGDWEARDDTFAPGETFATGFDQSHSGFLRYLDGDEAVTVQLSTDEQGGAQPSCVAFGTILGGPQLQSRSVASGAR